MFLTKTLKSYRGRGQVYSWLRAHQDSVAEKLGREEATWPLLVVEMAAHGVVGGRGAPPTPKAAAKVWRRVCADLRKAAEAQRQAAASRPPPRPGPVYPSRISPDWRPEEAPQISAPPMPKTPPESAPSQSLVPARPAGSAPLSPFADTRTKEEIEAHIQEQERKMDEMFAKHDRKYRFGG
jgi:hypothetical protein